MVHLCKLLVVPHNYVWLLKIFSCSFYFPESFSYNLFPLSFMLNQEATKFLKSSFSIIVAIKFVEIWTGYHPERKDVSIQMNSPYITMQVHYLCSFVLSHNLLCSDPTLQLWTKLARKSMKNENYLSTDQMVINIFTIVFIYSSNPHYLYICFIFHFLLQKQQHKNYITWAATNLRCITKANIHFMHVVTHFYLTLAS